MSIAPHRLQKMYRYTYATDVWSLGLSFASVLMQEKSSNATLASLKGASDCYHSGIAGSAQRSTQVKVIADKIVWMVGWGERDSSACLGLATLILKCIAIKPNSRIGMAEIVDIFKIIRLQSSLSKLSC